MRYINLRFTYLLTYLLTRHISVVDNTEIATPFAAADVTVASGD